MFYDSHTGNTNLIFFGLYTQPQLEHTIYNTQASTLTFTQTLIQSWILGKKRNEEMTLKTNP